MHPSDSVNHDTIRLVSLNRRLRRSMAAVLSTIKDNRGLGRYHGSDEKNTSAKYAKVVCRPFSGETAFVWTASATDALQFSVFRGSLPNVICVIRGCVLAVNDVECALLDGKRRFFHCFAESWMRVAGAAEIFRAAAELHHGRRLGD